MAGDPRPEAILSPDGAKWLEGARHGAVQALVRAREELTLAESGEAFRAQAAVDWARGFLGKAAAAIGLPRGTVPENEFAVLTQDERDGLQGRWQAKLSELERREVLEPGVYRPAIKLALGRIAALGAARGVPQVDPAARIGEALRAASAQPQVLTGIVRDWQARDAEIAQREHQLLDAALARDGTNVSAFARRVELLLGQTPPRDVLAGAILGLRRMQAVERAHHTYYAPALAAELVRERFTSPARAVWLDTLLSHQWQQSPGQYQANYPRWVASQLTDGQLCELMQLAELTLLQVRLVDASGAVVALGQIRVDVRAAERELAAMRAEAADRAAGRGGPAAALADVTTATLTAHLALPREAPAATGELAQRYFIHLREYLDRTGTNSEVEAERARVAMVGYAERVAELAGVAERVSRFAGGYRSYGGAPERVGEFTEIAVAIHRSAANIEGGLDALARAGTDPAKILILRQRLKANLVGVPPPAEDGAAGRAEPFGDPGLSRTLARAEAVYATLEAELTRVREQQEARVREQERLRAEAAERERRERAELERAATFVELQRTHSGITAGDRGLTLEAILRDNPRLEAQSALYLDLLKRREGASPPFGTPGVYGTYLGRDLTSDPLLLGDRAGSLQHLGLPGGSGAYNGTPTYSGAYLGRGYGYDPSRYGSRPTYEPRPSYTPPTYTRPTYIPSYSRPIFRPAR